MSRNKTLFFSLALLAFLCFQTQALSFFDGNSLRNTIMNAHATTSGIIELKRDYSFSSDYDSFYVEADLSYLASSSSNRSNSTNATKAIGTAKMMISIATSESMVATSCKYFNYYDCSQQYNCTESSSHGTIDYPSFTANVLLARAEMYLDYSYWSLSPYNCLFIAQSCYSNDTSTFIGYNRYGVIGLGTFSTYLWDFTSDKIFSIYIKPDLSGGKLLFKNDASTYAKSSNAIHTFSANETWQVSIYGGSLQVPGYSVYIQSSNLMFDINSDVIGLPYNIYTLFVKYFTSSTGASCGSGTYRPTCYYYSGKIEDLPDVTLFFNHDNLVIPSKVYASSLGETSFYLNFRGIASSLSGKSYVTPSFQNSIILGAPFMSYYYTVFDATSRSNIIYLYGSSDSPTNWQTIWIVVGAVGAIFLVGLCCCCCAKKNKSPVTHTTTVAPLNNTTVFYSTSAQAPLIYNQQGAAPNYSNDPNLYNNPGYNGAQQPQGMYSNMNDAMYQQQGGAYGGAGYVGYPQENAKQ